MARNCRAVVKPETFFAGPARLFLSRGPYSVLWIQQETARGSSFPVSTGVSLFSFDAPSPRPPPSPPTGLEPSPKIPAGGYGEDQNLRYLVMSRLGPDVEAAQEKGTGWSLAQKVGYARQMLALLRTLHNTCKMVFVDVKPGTRTRTSEARTPPPQDFELVMWFAGLGMGIYEARGGNAALLASLGACRT